MIGFNFFKLPLNIESYFFVIFLHGAEFIFVLIEFYVIQHCFISSYGKDIAVLKIYFSFFIMLSHLGMNSQIFEYEFMKITSTSKNLVIYIVSLIILLNFYVFYQWLTHRKNRYIFKNETISIRRINFNEETNNSSIDPTNDKEMNFVNYEIQEKK
jgi:hypothetical protein